MEFVWIALIAVALQSRQSRLITVLLGLKWTASYLGFLFIGEMVPAVSDVLFTTIFVTMIGSLTMRRAVVTALMILTLLVHAAYWIAWDMKVWLPDSYYLALLVLYTSQLLVVQPWEKVRDVLRWLDRSYRRRMARGLVQGNCRQTDDQITP